MRVLIIDNLAVMSSRRSLYREISRQIGNVIHLLVPNSWKEQGVITKCEEENTTLLNIHKSHFLFGYRHQRIIYTKLYKIISAAQPEIIFISSEPENFNTYHLVRIVKSSFPDIKLICATWRNIDYKFNPYPYKLGWLNRIIESYNRKYLDAIVAHTRTAEKLLLDLSFKNVTYIPPAINLDDFKYQPKLIDKHDFCVGYIGRLSYEKGVDVLIKAIAKIQGVSCIIAGRGTEKNKLLNLAKNLQLMDRIKFQDSVGYELVPEVMQKFHVLVLPSRTTEKWKEQFGRVLIEAMAVGILVVGSKSGNIPDVIGDCGFLFEEEDIDGLASIILKIRNAEYDRNILLRARKKVEDEFNQVVLAQKYVNLFKQLKA